MARMTALVAVLFALLTAVSSAALAGTAGTARAVHGRVVLIGIPGLMWSDLTAAGTPALWRLTGQASAAALSTRTTVVTTCPVDGWLTVSAGQRARLADSDCALPPAPALSGAGAQAPGWPLIKKDNASTGYQAHVGLLGDAVHQAGCTMAVGPGGVFGAADGGGRVDVYASSIGKVTDWSRCPFTAVDIDDVFRTFVSAGVDAQGGQEPVSLKDRAAAATAADRQVAQVLAAVPAGTTVLVAGLSDSSTSIPHLHVALSTDGRGYLTANSTRRSGLVTLTDVTATALKVLGLKQPIAAVGSDWRTVPSGDPAAVKVGGLNDQDVAAQAIRRMGGVFFIVLFAAQLLLYGAAAVALRRRWSGPERRRRVLGATRIVALAGAAAPVSTFLANLVPWWRSSHPAPMLVLSIAGWVVLVTALSLAGPWRRSVIGPGLVIAGLSAAVLGLDVLTGSNLQMNAFMGYSPLVAGRFYGFGNMAFAVFVTGAIMSAAWLAEWPSRAGRRGPAVAVVVVIGLAAMALDAWPGWGADFGGTPAIVPGTAVLALLIAGRRVSIVRVGLFCLAGAAMVLALAFADALRPAEQQTHLGRFWEQLVSGEAFGVIARKFVAMLASLGYWPFTVVTIGALCFLYFVLAKPLEWRPAPLERAYGHSPSLRPALLGALTVAVIAMLINDSGVEIPALAFSMAVPLVLAASVRALELDGDLSGTATPEPAEPPPVPTA